MGQVIRTQLILPVARHTLQLAHRYAHEVAVLAELAAAEAHSLAAAVEQACGRIVDLSYEPGDATSLSLVGEVDPSQVAILIQDRGLPLDTRQQSGIGSFEGAVDEATWLNRGPEGTELRLVKRRTMAHITDHLPEDELTPFHPEPPLAPPQRYDVRLMRPEEAINVAQVVYRTYGYSYINTDVYFPERFQHLHETGQLVSAVAVAESGEVAGHCALERPDLGRVAEMGQAVVSPAHRGRRLFEQMRELLMDQARLLGLAGVYGDAVATHTFSQRGERDSGARPVALLLGLAPPMDFKQINAAGAGQRISCVTYYKAVAEPDTHIVHVPDHHRPLIGRIYGELGRPATFAGGGRFDGPGQIRTEYQKGLQTGFIRVLQAGRETAAEIRQSRLDLVEAAGAEAVFLDIPLAQPGAPAVCRAAEEDGFFFCGVGPSFAPDGDVLRLQYLNCELDPGLLDILEPFGQEIRDYVVAERERVSRKG